MLKTKNDAIISAFTDAVKNGYEEYIDLIAVTGSFATGDFHKYSDLDLLIIINDDKARDLARCFILGDVGYDIYMVDWNHMESVASFQTPHVTKLIDTDIIYSSPSGIQKYGQLRNKLLQNMSDTGLREKRCSEHFSHCRHFIHKLNESSSKADVLMSAAMFIIASEYFIYTINGEYVRHGIRSVPSEIAKMNILPEGFTECYNRIINFSDENELKISCNKLYNIIKGYADTNIRCSIPDTHPEISERKLVPPTKENLKGTYEEICSNWRMKMLIAAETGDRYLSFMSSVSAQNFYDEMYEYFDIKHTDLISGFEPDDLLKNYEHFIERMDEYLTNYKAAGLDINYIKDISGLKNLYTN